MNGELVAIFANFFNRSFVLMHKLTNGKVPKFHNHVADEKDKALIDEIKDAKSKIENFIEEYKFRDALFCIIDLARSGNKYLQEKEPWIKAKLLTGESEQTTAAQIEIDNCLHVCLQLCANLAIYINPFLPNTAKKMITMMKVVDKVLDWENAGSVKLLSVGYSLRPQELLFRKIGDEEVAYQIEKLKKGMEASKAQNQEATVQSQEATSESSKSKVQSLQSEIESANGHQISSTDPNSPLTDGGLKPEIVYDNFDKLDLRIGTILSAEKVKKADRLLQLEVDLGFEKRTIVSGIAQHFIPEELVNKQVIVVANLAPRKMKGIESKGMILTAEQPDGKLILVSPDSATINGSNVK